MASSSIGPRSRAAVAAGLVALAGCGKLGSSDDRVAVQAAYGGPPPPTQVVPSATPAPSLPTLEAPTSPDASARDAGGTDAAAKPR